MGSHGSKGRIFNDTNKSKIVWNVQIMDFCSPTYKLQTFQLLEFTIQSDI